MENSNVKQQTLRQPLIKTTRLPRKNNYGSKTTRDRHERNSFPK